MWNSHWKYAGASFICTKKPEKMVKGIIANAPHTIPFWKKENVIICMNRRPICEKCVSFDAGVQ